MQSRIQPSCFLATKSSFEPLPSPPWAITDDCPFPCRPTLHMWSLVAEIPNPHRPFTVISCTSCRAKRPRSNLDAQLAHTNHTTKFGYRRRHNPFRVKPLVQAIGRIIASDHVPTSLLYHAHWLASHVRNESLTACTTLQDIATCAAPQDNPYFYSSNMKLPVPYVQVLGCILVQHGDRSCLEFPTIPL